MRSFYKFIPHTADIGVQISSSSLTGLYENSAKALFDIIAGLCNISRKIKKHIVLTAPNKEELLIRWLNELLYFFSVHYMVFSDFKITFLDDKNIKATVFGEVYKDRGYAIKREIKAATYHGLNLEKIGNRYKTTIIFDV